MAVKFNLNSAITPELATAALTDAKRADKAAQYNPRDVIQTLPGIFLVKSQSGRREPYHVSNSAPDLTGEWMCDCPDYQKRLLKLNDEYRQQGSTIRIHCKHIRVAKTLQPERCEWNPDTCPGCMLEKFCKAHAERVEKMEHDNEQRRAMTEVC